MHTVIKTLLNLLQIYKKYIRFFYVKYIIMKNYIKLPLRLKSSSESESESESDNEETIQNNSTNLIKIQNMEDNSVVFYKTIVDIRNCWKIQNLNLCHCGRYHYLSNHTHEIIELIN